MAMSQLEQIISATLNDGLTTSPDRVAQIVTRQDKQVSVINLPQLVSAIMILGDGGKEEQPSLEGLPPIYWYIASRLNESDKTLLALYLVNKDIVGQIGVVPSMLWSSNPVYTVVMLALGFRVWGNIIDPNDPATLDESVRSILKRYSSVNGSKVIVPETGRMMYACRPDVASLPYESDVKTVDITRESSVDDDDILVKLGASLRDAHVVSMQHISKMHQQHNAMLRFVGKFIHPADAMRALAHKHTPPPLRKS